MSSNSCDSNGKSTEDCRCMVPLNEITHIWTLNNFSSAEEQKKNVSSPKFSAVTNDNFIWYLILKPCGQTGSGSNVSLYLHLSPLSKSKKAYGRLRFSVLNEKHEEMKLEHFLFDHLYHTFDNTGVSADKLGNSWGRAVFLEKNEFFRNEILFDDKLTISCELSFFEMNERNAKTLFHRRQCNSAALQHLSKDLTSVVENPRFTDVVLSLKGKDYPAHKVMLSARSNVFAAMFNYTTKENTQNRVEIPDIREDVMEEMLRYLYTGNCDGENFTNLAGDLLIAAEKYDVTHLKQVCEESLYKNLTVENAPNVLVLAETYNAKKLKSEVINFIVAKSSDVICTATWKNLMPSYPLLLNEVLFVIVSRQNAAS